MYASRKSNVVKIIQKINIIINIMTLTLFYFAVIGVTEWYFLYIYGYYDDDWSSGSISENFVQQQHSYHFPQKYIIHKQGKQIQFSQ